MSNVPRKRHEKKPTKPADMPLKPKERSIPSWPKLVPIAVLILGGIVGTIIGVLSQMPGSGNTLAEDVVSLDDADYWSSLKKDCGRPKIEPELISSRIVGGTEAKRNSWAWQVSLARFRGYGTNVKYRHVCGGSLIAPNFVITAVHCFLKKGPSGNKVTNDGSDYRIIAGAHDKSSLVGGARTSEIESIYHHPDNNLERYGRDRSVPKNDLTLLKLQRAFDPSRDSPVVTFACLPRPDIIPMIGKRCWATGWGKTQGSGYEKVLKQTPMPILSQSNCNEYYRKKIDYKYHLCVREKDTGTCQGDSGGPLVCLNDQNRWVLYGATSFGSKPCSSGPSVFVSIASYMKWICCILKDPDVGPCGSYQC